MKQFFVTLLLCLLIIFKCTKCSNWSNSMYCGQLHPSITLVPLMHGGSPICDGTWPWMAGIFMKRRKGFEFGCGGTLISTRLIITAAHCFIGTFGRIAKEDIKVTLGQYTLSDKNEENIAEINIRDIKIHPDFKEENWPRFDADIAVIISDSVITFTAYIQPACLMSGNRYDLIGKVGAVVGRGQDESGQLSNIPKVITTNIVSPQSCTAVHEAFSGVQNGRAFCATNSNNAVPDKGDSGSGLLILENGEWVLRGVVSSKRRPQAANPMAADSYVVYADTSDFIDWIYNINKSLRCIVKKGRKIPRRCKNLRI